MKIDKWEAHNQMCWEKWLTDWLFYFLKTGFEVKLKSKASIMSIFRREIFNLKSMWIWRWGIWLCIRAPQSEVHGPVPTWDKTNTKSEPKHLETLGAVWHCHFTQPGDFVFYKNESTAFGNFKNFPFTTISLRCIDLA